MTAAQENAEALKVLGLDDEEGESVLPDESATARVVGPARICTDYLNTVHPETGLGVVFVPGEALPEWAYAEQTARNTVAVPESPIESGNQPLRAVTSRKKADKE